MNRTSRVKSLTFGGIYIAIYVLFTNMNPFGWGPWQVRISEIMLTMPFWNKKYAKYALVAVVVANCFSPLGVLDIACGGACAVATYYIVQPIVEKILRKKKFSIPFMCLIVYPIVCGLIVGALLTYAYALPYWSAVVSCLFGQIAVGVISLFVNGALVKIIDKFWN